MLSVIIPARDCERPLVRTLAVLVGAAVAGTVRDVIVADGGSTDDTAQAAEIAGCTVLVSEAPLAARLKEAAAQARGPWLLFLRAGALPDGGWDDDVVRFVETAERRGTVETAAAFRGVPLADDGASFGRRAVALLRETFSRKPSPDQGLLISRRYYDALGGHRDAGDPEAELLGRIGTRLVRLRSAVTIPPEPAP
ncbi:glycosyl transferase, family 2 [Rhodovulum sp. PH10]|uniref:glycosyltransferase n=1 Tax=Rhodovulum sp. PH10 TaxID=1187851 RepID=UPI00027C2C86|nr:glycosyltransferase [Rhodovulum sp. PH10]EJW10614.1 glycosyl transferase, family 2 [Rhodovulum sp. PH10]